MWRKQLNFTMAFILLWTAGSQSVLLAQTQDTKTITDIQIVGNKNIGQEAILAAISEKPGTPFSRDQMTSDREAIEKMGFFSVASAKSEDVPGGVKLIFEVVENPKVSAIEFSGNTVATRQELLDAIRTKEGQVYNSNTLDQDLRAVEDLYAKKGNLAYVTAEASIDPQTGVLKLPILEFKVGKIQFTGLKKTKSWVLMREMKLKPGMIYNANTLQKDITRVYELDYLDVEKAELPRKEPSEQEGYLDIIIPVQEKRTGTVSVGLGYSSLQKVVGRIEITERNFRGKGLGVNGLYEVSGTGSGASYELGFFNPWFRKDHTSLSVRGYNKAIYRFSSSALGGGSDLPNDADYRERRKGGSIGLSKPFGENVYGFLTLRQESVDSSVTNAANLSPDLIFTTQNGQVTGLAMKGSYDTRDFSLDPGAGSYISATYEPGIARVEHRATNMFTKLDFDVRKYISSGGRKISPKDKRKTLALRLQASWSTGFLPFFEQFFVGGAERLRGYREDRFWGNRMLLSSAEFRIPMSGGLSGVLFTDYGGAWGGDYMNLSPNFPQTRTFKGHLGYGAGIRVATPLGNLRFDYGFGSEGARTHFSIGQAF